MTERPVTNMAASVHQRLLNLAKEQVRPFNEILQYYAMERFLHRLAHSRHGNRFVLKGALMLQMWKAPISRPTMDIDLLGRMDNSVDTLVAVTQDICRERVEPDGLEFVPETVTGERIAEEAEYAGVRLRLRALLGKARVTIQIDVGFGDAVYPNPVRGDYPTILPFPAPNLLAYRRETAVAEKFEAMVTLGLLNSRMKDFFDIWLLCRQFDFDGDTLATAVAKTFAQRKTIVVGEPDALAPGFADTPGKREQWRAFVRRTHFEKPTPDMGDLIRTIREFLQPVASALASGAPFRKSWTAPGPWRD